MALPSTQTAVRFDHHGGAEVLDLVEVPVPSPGPGEILIRHAAVGLNFIDIYQRTGLYPLPLPSGLGKEAAGTVEAIGDLNQPSGSGPIGWMNSGSTFTLSTSL